MKFRWPKIMPSFVVATVGLFVFTSVLLAQPPAKPGVPATPPVERTGLTPEQIKDKQAVNFKKFVEFKESLFRLAKRLELSDRAEDKETAKVIQRAIEVALKENVDGQFQKLLIGLSKANKTIGELGDVSNDEKQLGKMLQEILNILNTDDETARIKAEIAKLEALLKEARFIKQGTESVQARTQSNSGNSERLTKEQQDLAKRTKDLADKAAGVKSKEAKPEDAKSGEKAEPKAGESGANEKKDTGEDKGSPKAGEPKDGAEPMKGEPKEATPPKPGQDMAKEGEAGAPKEAKSGEGKGEPKGMGEGKGEGKSEKKPDGGEGKRQGNAGEGKPGEGKPGEGKPGEGKPGQPGPAGEPGQPKPAPGAKEIQQAVPPQQQAEKELDKNKRTEAGQKQDEAIAQLAKAIEELEKRLKQLREEEMKKLLANVEVRCNKMRQMQIDVYEATKSIDKAIIARNGVKETSDQQKAQTQGDKEKEIIAEADRALKLLESEGSAVAFATVLEEVRQDMIAVQRRLAQTYADKGTQSIEEDIIAMLKDMIDALKKAQQDLAKPKPSDSKPNDGKPPDKKLIDLLAELKLIRTLQVSINNRTTTYGGKNKVEQSNDPIIQGELRQLSTRQIKLQDMIDKIANGSNQ